VRTVLEGIKGRVCCVAFAPDGQTLVTVGMGFPHSVILWDPQTGKRKLEKDLGEAYTDTLAADFSPDSRTLVVVGTGPIGFWDVTSGRRRHEIKIDTGANCVAWSPNTDLIAVGFIDGTVRLYDVPKNK